LQDALSHLPSAQRQALTARLSRKATFRSLLSAPSQVSFESRIIFDARQRIERAAFTIGQGRKAGEDAAELAGSVAVSYEWEGYPDGPMDEARSAEAYLRAHPDSSVKDYVQLLLMHRFRCAFEAAERSIPEAETVMRSHREEWLKEMSTMQRQAAVGYRSAWDRLKDSRDNAVVSIANDIDRARYLYVPSIDHPRTFKIK
jgi:hypothetical protein